MQKSHYTVVSSRRPVLFWNKPRTLLAPVPDKSVVGGWLDEYRNETNDLGFEEIEIHEVKSNNETVVHDDAHRFIDHHRHDLHRAELELKIETDQLQQAA